MLTWGVRWQTPTMEQLHDESIVVGKAACPVWKHRQKQRHGSEEEGASGPKRSVPGLPDIRFLFPRWHVLRIQRINPAPTMVCSLVAAGRPARMPEMVAVNGNLKSEQTTGSGPAGFIVCIKRDTNSKSGACRKALLAKLWRHKVCR